MRRISPIDWILIVVVGAGLPVAFGMAAESARDAEQGNKMGAGFAMGARLHENVDPINPPGLPAGVTVDPATGYLVGVDLEPREGETFLKWSTLTASTYPNGVSDVPADVTALHGKPVAMVGFVMPLFEPEQFREFVLVGSTLTCCYGKPPGLGGVLKVDLHEEATALDMDPRPVLVRGRFVIKEMRLNEADPKSPVVLLYRIEDGETGGLR